MMGGTSKLIGIAEVIYDQIGIEAHPLGNPIEGENDQIISGGDPALFAQSIALALRATSLGTTRLNFRQDEFAYRTNIFQMLSQDLRPTAILAAIAAGLALFSFGTSLALESSRARSLEKRAQELYSELSRRIPRDVKVQFEDINIDRRVVKIKVLGESYQSADRLKSLLARSAPFADAEVDKVKSTRGGAGKRFNLTLSLTADGESS